MSYRTILALASGQSHDKDALAVACDLALRFEAEARVLPSAPDPAEVSLGYDLSGIGALSSGFGAKFKAERAQAAAAIRTATREAAEEAEIPYGARKPGACVTVVKGYVSPWLTLLEEAPFGDLAVIAREAAIGSAVLSSVFADALMDLRLPILIANGTGSAAARTAVVAWNGSMEAGRAMRAALPLLLMADRVLVAQHEAHLHWDQQGAAMLKRCTDYLERHGVAKLDSLQIHGEIGREALLETVRDARADLLVAGAYGHPRWQEFLFGGFTRALFAADDAPHVLVSH